MSLKLVRPLEDHGHKLFYRSIYNVEDGRVGGYYMGEVFFRRSETDCRSFLLLEPGNIIAQLRLYRWFSREYEKCKKSDDPVFNGRIIKDDLIGILFSDYPAINKVRIGRLMRMLVKYETNFQRNRCEATNHKNVMYWKWFHCVEFVYALEHLMITWLPMLIEADNGCCKTVEEYEEELEIIRSQSPEEDLNMASLVMDRRVISMLPPKWRPY